MCSLVHFSLKLKTSNDQRSFPWLDMFSKVLHGNWRSVKTSKALQDIAIQEYSLTVFGVLFIFFLNIAHLIKHPLHQNSICPPMSASAKHPLIRQLSENTSHNTTESPNIPDISTSRTLWEELANVWLGTEFEVSLGILCLLLEVFEMWLLNSSCHSARAVIMYSNLMKL